MPMEELIKFGYPNLVGNRMNSLMPKMDTDIGTRAYVDRKVWFSMWFLAAIVTFGIAFFPMFYRLIEGRNRHFQKNAELERQITLVLRIQGKEPPKLSEHFGNMKVKAWTASIILIIPVFAIVYFLSKDLVAHERNQDVFLGSAFPEKMFMPQTIPIKTYVLITIATLGVGVVYWLYKVVNFYNAHFKADLQLEKEVSRLVEEEKTVEHV
jgi:hypothetical protein